MMGIAHKITFVETRTGKTFFVTLIQRLIVAFQACILLSFVFVPNFITSEVKLVGGSGSNEGNIFVGGLAVCDDYHDTDNARVVCRSCWEFGLLLVYY